MQLPFLTLPYGIGLLGYEACCARSHRALDFVLYSILVGYGIPDLSPVLVQPSLEGIERWGTHDFGRKAIPIIYDPCGKGESSSPRRSQVLVEFERMPPRRASSQSEKRARVHV